jgi:hypothetical protein
MSPETENLMHFLQESRIAAGISYRICGLRLGVTRQRVHQIIERGTVGQAMAQKILADMINGEGNPFPPDVMDQARRYAAPAVAG